MIPSKRVRFQKAPPRTPRNVFKTMRLGAYPWNAIEKKGVFERKLFLFDSLSPSKANASLQMGDEIASKINHIFYFKRKRIFFDAF